MFSFNRRLLESKKSLLNYLDTYNTPEGAKILKDLITYDLNLIDTVKDVPPALLQAIRKNGKVLTPERIIQEIKEPRFPYIYPLLQSTKGRRWVAKQVKNLKKLARSG